MGYIFANGALERAFMSVAKKINEFAQSFQNACSKPTEPVEFVAILDPDTWLWAEKTALREKLLQFNNNETLRSYYIDAESVGSLGIGYNGFCAMLESLTLLRKQSCYEKARINGVTVNRDMDAIKVKISL